jgi:hypothetical protein
MRTLGEGSNMRSAAARETKELRALRERALSLRFAGVPFRDHAERCSAPFVSDLAEDLYEAFTFAHLAVGANIDTQVRDIVKCSPPKPDLLVHLTDKSSVYVEVGRVRPIASGRHFGEIQALNKGLMLAAKSEPAIVQHVHGRHVSFGMRDVSSKNNRQTVVSEIIETLRSIRFDESQPWIFFDSLITRKPTKRLRLKPDPLIAPTLSKLGVSIDVVEFIREQERSTYVTVRSRAGIGMPSDSVLDFDNTLQAKNARRYDAKGALWLAMPLEDDMQLPAASLRRIRAARTINLGQFDRVIVGTLQDAEVIDRR